MDEPRFAQPIPNVTVAVGRDANLPCVVEHLGGYKVSSQCNVDAIRGNERKRVINPAYCERRCHSIGISSWRHCLKSILRIAHRRTLSIAMCVNWQP